MARKIGWRGSSCPKVLIVGECPSASDVKFGKAFTGVEEILLKEWLDKVGIRADEVRVGHLLDERPLGGDPMRHVAQRKAEMTPDHELVDGRWVDSALRRGREALGATIDQYKPNVVVAAGNLALWALTGNWGIQSWRGSLLVNTLSNHPAKVIPTISPFKVNISYEWYSIVEKDFGRVAKERHGLEMPEREEHFLTRPSFEDTIETLDKLIDRCALSEDGHDLACDIETRAGHIACVGLGWSATEAICIPFMDVEVREGYWSAEEELEIQNLLLDLLTHPNCRVIGQNFQYDLQYFWKHLKYEPNLQWDTMIVHHSLFPSGRSIETAGDAGKKATGRDVLKKSLGFLSSIYCKDHWYWKEDREGWETEDEYWAYNCRDCVRTWEIAQAQKRMIAKRGQKQTFVSAFQQDLFWPVWEIMKRGLLVDKAKRSEYKKSLQDAIKERELWFEEVLGHPLNIGSPVQMKTLFYTDLGQKPVTKRGPPGKPAVVTCDDAAMAVIVEREPLLRPLISRIQEIRSLGVFLNTFIEAKVDDDGQMRSSLNIPGTKTYRFSSNKTAFEGGCFPSGAEALTLSGWVKLEDLHGQEVAAFDKSTRELKWQNALPYKAYYDGGLFLAKSEQISLALTPSHRVLAGKAGRGTEKDYLANELASFNSQFNIPVGGLLVKGDKTFTAPRLLVAVLADGSYEKKKSRLAFKKSRKSERLIHLCELYGVDYKEISAPEGYRRFSITRPDDWPSQKKWGQWVLELDPATRAEMLDEIRYWDGNNKGGSFTFFSADKEQAEWVQTMAHLSGQGATLREVEKSENSYSDTLMYWVNVKPRGHVGLEGKHWSTKPYKGEVYCLSVPSTYFLVRWEGFISVTGNCNFQNIPANQKKKDADQLTMPDVRKMFIPPAGMTIFDSDLDSADLRIVTEEGDVEEMRQMFREGKKPYVEIAKEYYRDPTIDKSHWAYGIFKSLCHGTNYLGASAGLASRCGLLVAEVERIQAWYFGKFPGIRKWQEEIKQQVMGRRYIENAFGYRFPFLGRITEESFREAVAWIPQSSVAIIINHILKNLTRNLSEVKLINQVHDSLVGYFPTAQRDILLPKITAEAQIVVPYPSKLIIPVGFKTSDVSWGDAK